MFPLREVRDRTLPRRRAMVTFVLLAANVLAFILEQAMIEAGNSSFPIFWGLVPQTFSVDPGHGLLTVVTSMFLHGGWFHLIGNLWFLWLFGPSVEDALGSPRFSALYLLGGVAAAASQVAVDPMSRMPMLGASGAIGAVLAAYVSLFPFRRITTLIPIVIVPLIFRIPALIFVIEWFAINLLQGIGGLELHPDATAGVAWWAHVGGFLSGLLLVRFLFPQHLHEGEGEGDKHEPLFPTRPIDGGDVVVRDAEGAKLPTSRGGDDSLGEA